MFEVMGAVLAGGRSIRMGGDKATLALADGTMGEIVAATLTEVLDRTVVVGGDRPLAGLEVVADLGAPHQGPLAGLVAVLTAFQSPVVMVAVDQPLLRTETVRQLAILAAEGHTALCHDEVPQVTCAAYQPELLDGARRHLESGGSIRSLLDASPHTLLDEEVWSAWGEDGRSWFSLDRPDDIVEAERRFRVGLLD